MKLGRFFVLFVIAISAQVFAQDMEMTLDREFEEIEPPKESPKEIVIEQAEEPPKPIIVDDNRIQSKNELPQSQSQRIVKKPIAKIQSGTVNVGGGKDNQDRAPQCGKRFDQD